MVELLCLPGAAALHGQLPYLYLFFLIPLPQFQVGSDFDHLAGLASLAIIVDFTPLESWLEPRLYSCRSGRHTAIYPGGWQSCHLGSLPWCPPDGNKTVYQSRLVTRSQEFELALLSMGCHNGVGGREYRAVTHRHRWRPSRSLYFAFQGIRMDQLNQLSALVSRISAARSSLVLFWILVILSCQQMATLTWRLLPSSSASSRVMLGSVAPSSSAAAPRQLDARELLKLALFGKPEVQKWPSR